MLKKNSCTQWVPGYDVTIEGLSISDNSGVQDGSHFGAGWVPNCTELEDPSCTQALLTNQQWSFVGVAVTWVQEFLITQGEICTYKSNCKLALLVNSGILESEKAYTL